MERPRSLKPEGISYDPSFANLYLKDAASLDREFGIASQAGLGGVDQETFRIYLAQRQLIDEISQARDFSLFNQRGVIRPLTYYYHRRLGVENPYFAARNSLDLAIGIHIDRNYGQDIDRPFLIRSSVNNLAARMTVPHLLRGFGSAIEFERWEPTGKLVKKWGDDWRHKFIRTQ